MLCPRTCRRKRPLKRKLSAARATSAAVRVAHEAVGLLSLCDTFHYPSPLQTDSDTNWTSIRHPVPTPEPVSLQGNRMYSEGQRRICAFRTRGTSDGRDDSLSCAGQSFPAEDRKAQLHDHNGRVQDAHEPSLFFLAAAGRCLQAHGTLVSSTCARLVLSAGNAECRMPLYHHPLGRTLRSNSMRWKMPIQ